MILRRANTLNPYKIKWDQFPEVGFWSLTSGLPVIRPQQGNASIGISIARWKIRLALPGELGRRALRFAWGAECGLHPFDGAGKVVWVLDHMGEEAACLKREAAKRAIC
jgi:hypothetical protein